ncbi:MAG: RNA polymerase sigma factor [Planctomycetes bacterium]|nr:RNA polymerase sigma factor [Planctomycetota bacterium]
MSVSDRELLQRSASGDRAAFDAFVERHGADVFRYARWVAGDETDAEDVLQQTFLDAWNAAGDARAENGARAWLVSIARRNALRVSSRRGAAREQSLEELGELAGFGDPEHTPERVARAAEQRGLVEDALAALEPEEREILVLRDVEELPGASVAELLGLSLAAQKSRLHRARLRLAAQLRRHCGLEQQA